MMTTTFTRRALVQGTGTLAATGILAGSGLTEWARAYHGANHERLTRVKARYDPDNLFRAHQSP